MKSTVYLGHDDDHSAVRFVEITIPTGKRDAVLRVLEDEGIDYVLTEQTGSREYTAVVSFPLPQPAVEPVLDRLRNAGLSSEAYTVVLEAETVISRRFDELAERYEESDTGTDRIAREEISSRADDLAPTLATYTMMVSVSVVIATAGVLLDSAAIVVGSMVIAPLIGPAMATSVGTVLQDRGLFLRGTKLQLLGFLLAIATAAGFAWLLKVTYLVPISSVELVGIDEVRQRLAPDILSLVVALGAGIAGAYSLSSGVSTSLVGVAIAVALVPPTAVIGIGIAWGLPGVVIGSTILVLVNFLSINLAALAVFWYQGYRPEHGFHISEARSDTIKRVAALGVAILVLSSFLGAVTVSSYQTATIEGDAQTAVETVLDRDRYENLTLIEVSFETDTGPLFRTPERVIVTVGRPSQNAYPTFATDLADQLESGIAVEVRFVEVDRVGGEGVPPLPQQP